MSGHVDLPMRSGRTRWVNVMVEWASRWMVLCPVISKVVNRVLGDKVMANQIGGICSMMTLRSPMVLHETPTKPCSDCILAEFQVMDGVLEHVANGELVLMKTPRHGCR